MKLMSQIVLLPIFMAIPFARTSVTSKTITNRASVEEHENYNATPPVTSINSANFGNIDLGSEAYIPPNKVYLFREAIALRENLISQVKANPNSLELNWALMRFYACAPNFVGGNRSMALQYASAIYSLNNYLGCLAHEYVYSKNYQFENAERWYKKSLICTLLPNAQWKEFKYTNLAPIGVGVYGEFSNFKVQPLYQNLNGSFVRKVMMPICNGECAYKILKGYVKPNDNVKAEMTVLRW